LASMIFSMIQEGEDMGESVWLTRHWVDKAELAVSVNNCQELLISSTRCRCGTTLFRENRAWEGIGAWRAASWLSGRVR
jgi:hypothetical protein